MSLRPSEGLVPSQTGTAHGVSSMASPVRRHRRRTSIRPPKRQPSGSQHRGSVSLGWPRRLLALAAVPLNPHSAGRPPRVRPWASYGRRPPAQTHDLRRPASVTFHLLGNDETPRSPPITALLGSDPSRRRAIFPVRKCFKSSDFPQASFRFAGAGGIGMLLGALGAAGDTVMGLCRHSGYILSRSYNRPPQKDNTSHLHEAIASMESWFRHTTAVNINRDLSVERFPPVYDRAPCDIFKVTKQHGAAPTAP